MAVNSCVTIVRSRWTQSSVCFSTPCDAICSVGQLRPMLLSKCLATAPTATSRAYVKSTCQPSQYWHMYGTVPTLPEHNDAALARHQNTPLRGQAVAGENYLNVPHVGAKRLREQLVDPIPSLPTNNVNTTCTTQAPFDFDIFDDFFTTAGDGTSTPE